MTKVKIPVGIFYFPCRDFPHVENFPAGIFKNVMFIFLFKYEKISCKWCVKWRSTSNNNVWIFPTGIWIKIPAGIFKTSDLVPKNKPMFTLAICLTHLSLFQNIRTFWFSPTHGDFLLQGYFPMEIFFLLGIYPMRNLFNGKVFLLHLSAIIHFYIIYGIDPA